MSREISEANDYKDKLLKLIPSEIVAAYMVIEGLMPEDQNSSKYITVGVTAFLIAITPVYLTKLYHVHRKRQIVFTSLSLIVWIYSLGGPFKLWGIYTPQLASIILILWTLLIPLIVSQRGEPLLPDDLVNITTKTPKTKFTPKGVIEWAPEMKQHLGKQARVTEISDDTLSLKLDADDGQHWWSTDWVERAP